MRNSATKKFVPRKAEGVRERSPGAFELRFEGPRDRAGKRKALSATFKCDTLDEAIRERRCLQADVDAGRHVERSKLQVGDYVKQRIDRWVALDAISPKTAERYRELLAYQIVPHLGGVELQKLKAADIEEWHATLLTSGRRDGAGGLAKMTTRHAHRLLGKCLSEAQRHELIIKNPASLHSPPKVAEEEEEVVILTAEQARMVVSMLKGRAIYPKVILGLGLGARRGEILAFRWDHIDFDRRTISIKEALEETKGGLRFKKPKTKDGVREIVMPDIVVDVLREYRKHELEQRLALGRGKLAGTDLLFTRIDGMSPQSPHALSAEWRKAAEGIGLGNITFHALRHTHASHLISAGVDVVKVAKRLGHSDPTITLRVYAHLFRKLEDKSAEAVNAAVADLASA